MRIKTKVIFNDGASGYQYVDTDDIKSVLVHENGAVIAATTMGVVINVHMDSAEEFVRFFHKDVEKSF